jgi:hypothetical protein
MCDSWLLCSGLWWCNTGWRSGAPLVTPWQCSRTSPTKAYPCLAQVSCPRALRSTSIPPLLDFTRCILPLLNEVTGCSCVLALCTLSYVRYIALLQTCTQGPWGSQGRLQGQGMGLPTATGSGGSKRTCIWRRDIYCCFVLFLFRFPVAV